MYLLFVEFRLGLFGRSQIAHSEGTLLHSQSGRAFQGCAIKAAPYFATQSTPVGAPTIPNAKAVTAQYHPCNPKSRRFQSRQNIHNPLTSGLLPCCGGHFYNKHKSADFYLAKVFQRQLLS